MIKHTNRSNLNSVPNPYARTCACQAIQRSALRPEHDSNSTLDTTQAIDGTVSTGC